MGIYMKIYKRGEDYVKITAKSGSEIGSIYYVDFRFS